MDNETNLKIEKLQNTVTNLEKQILLLEERIKTIEDNKYYDIEALLKSGVNANRINGKKVSNNFPTQGYLFYDSSTNTIYWKAK